MKATIQIYKDKKEQIHSLLQRHLIIQKPRIQTNKKVYKRERYKGDIE